MDIPVSEALVIKPGDTLIIRYGRRLSAQEVDEMVAYLRPAIPSTVKILIIEAEQIAVVRP
jgi:hypothetical protein